MKKKTESPSKSASRSRVGRPKASARPKVQRVPQASLPVAAPAEGLMSGIDVTLSGLAVGHSPAKGQRGAEAELFKAFQSNLLSLISHELRTPLTGVMNALNLLEAGEPVGDLTDADLIKMARQNAQRLHRALVMILDAAAIESGTFHARLREMDLAKLVQGRVESYRSSFKDQNLEVGIEETEGLAPLLGDPQKVSRAIELSIQAIVPRARGTLQVRISSSGVGFEFELADGMQTFWDNAWSQAVAGFHGGVGSPSSIFGGVIQSEQAFLTRMEEGLGSELILVHEIMRQHQGSVQAERSGGQVRFELLFPSLSSEAGLRAVLTSRAYHVSTELGSVAVVLIRVPKQTQPEDFRRTLKRSLFRSSDAVYSLPERMQVAMVLDDCKPEDAPRLLQRLKTSLGQDLSFGIAHCPADGLDPSKLLDIAADRISD